MTEPIIQAHGLVKAFRTPARQAGRFGALRTLITREYSVNRAVDGIGFDIEPGELVGYIGPNGAGKSTTIKILTGILEPSAGDATVAGLVPWRQREQNAQNIGVVFGQRSQLWWDLPLIETFRLVAQMYRIEPGRYERNLARFRDLLALDEFIERPVRQLSLGQRMRGEITAALLHDPRIVYLDEPTVGLDIVAKARIREFIAEMNRERGTTIILTTHDLVDVERLCRRIILIDQGRVLFDGSIESLMTRYAPHRRLDLRLASGDAAPVPLSETAVAAGVEVAVEAPGVVSFRFDPARVSVQALISEVVARYEVSDLSIVEPELEAVVRQLYERREGAS